jgi:hypothetical protein
VSEINLAMINRAGVAALPVVVARLLPGGEIFGRDYIARERRHDRRPGSFKVKLFGAHAGTWADFATGDRGGDPVSLVAHLERVSEADAALHLARMLGIAP